VPCLGSLQGLSSLFGDCVTVCIFLIIPQNRSLIRNFISEHENAPSALTRCISALNLSRQPSVSSIHSSHSHSRSMPTPRAHPLSRSYSSGSLPDPNQYGIGFDGFDEFGRFQDGRHRNEWSSSSLPNFKQRGQRGRSPPLPKLLYHRFLRRRGRSAAVCGQRWENEHKQCRFWVFAGG
jgi:hypothetical protein